jgi:hypothetical protein
MPRLAVDRRAEQYRAHAQELIAAAWREDDVDRKRHLFNLAKSYQRAADAIAPRRRPQLRFSGASNKQTHTQAHRSTRAANHGRGAAKRKGAGRGLLVRLVDNLVSLSASEVAEGDEVLKTQAHFYRVLIANCERKAEMAEQLAEKFGKDDAS